MRCALLIITCILLSATFHAQLFIEGRIQDAQSGQPVPFCAVGLRQHQSGTISNEEGVFTLRYYTDTDTVLIQNVGYKTLRLSISALRARPLVKLEQSSRQLQEVVVYSNDQFVYELVSKCRTLLAVSPVCESKAYFTLSTDAGGQATELLECHYNAQQNNAALQNLAFKNGRVGVAAIGNRFFVSLNTSKAISFIDLLHNNGQFPEIPLQLNARQLKKKFRLSLADTSASENYHIRFEPRQKDNRAFSGELWIDRQNGQLSKVVLQVTEARTHPFLPLFPQGSVENVSLQIEKSFRKSGNAVQPQHLYFNYQLNYRVGDSVRLVKSKGLLYFYDYQRLFVLPYFSYDPELEDYRKISLLSYHDAFWATTTSLVYSTETQKQLAYFRKNGLLLNYQNDGNLRRGILKNQNSFFENNNLLWSEKKRVRLKQSKLPQDTVAGARATYVFQKYKLKVQIFLDVIERNDSLVHFSATVLDAYQTYYNLPEETFTNCFLNIYFDLVELERRKMEERLKQLPHTKENYNKVYALTLQNIEAMELAYFKAVEHGKNKKELKHYNEQVKSELQLDNFVLLGCDSPSKN